MLTAIFIGIITIMFLVWFLLSDEDSIIPKEYVGVATCIFLVISVLMLYLEFR